MTFPCLLAASSLIQCDVSEMGYVNLLPDLKRCGTFFLHPSAIWNAYMKAGVQAAILIPAIGTHFWSNRNLKKVCSLRTLWNAISVSDYIMGFNERDLYMFLSLSLLEKF